MGFGGSDKSARYARQEQVRRENQIRTGAGLINKQFAPFNEGFYQQRAQDYLKYAMPQFGQQYLNTRNNMLFGLANRGLGKSSSSRNMADRFSFAANTQRQGLVDAGLSHAQALRGEVENARTNLINQLQASADPSLAAQGAIRAASGFTAPSTFAPVGDLFQGFANMYLAKQLRNAYAPITQYAGGGGQGGTGWAPGAITYVAPKA